LVKKNISFIQGPAGPAGLKGEFGMPGRPVSLSKNNFHLQKIFADRQQHT